MFLEVKNQKVLTDKKRKVTNHVKLDNSTSYPNEKESKCSTTDHVDPTLMPPQEILRVGQVSVCLDGVSATWTHVKDEMVLKNITISIDKVCSALLQLVISLNTFRFTDIVY